MKYVQKGNHEKCKKIIPSKPTNTQKVPKIIRSIDLETNEGIFLLIINDTIRILYMFFMNLIYQI